MTRPAAAEKLPRRRRSVSQSVSHPVRAEPEAEAACSGEEKGKQSCLHARTAGNTADVYW